MLRSSDDELPFDPTRPPWGGDDGELRHDYRARLAELDADLLAAARQVVAMAAPIADVASPVGPAVVERGRERLAWVRAAAVRIEDEAFTLTAVESPVGRDLREVVAVIRGVYDVVRSARLVVHVLEHLATLERCGQVTGTGPLGRMRELSVEVLDASVEAWADRDALAHVDLDARDREVDDLRAALQAQQPPCREAVCVTAHVLLVRFLERLGDHGVDLTAHLSWAVTGDRVLAEYGQGRADT